MNVVRAVDRWGCCKVSRRCREQIETLKNRKLESVETLDKLVIEISQILSKVKRISYILIVCFTLRYTSEI